MGKPKRYKNEVPISPMIDIIFLMIFFFVLSAVLDDGMNDNIDMVKVKNAKPSKPVPKKIFISVDEEGQVYFDNGLPVTQSVIKPRLRDILNTWGNATTFVIRADKDATHEYVDNAMQQLKESGARSIVISGEIIN